MANPHVIIPHSWCFESKQHDKGMLLFFVCKILACCLFMVWPKNMLGVWRVQEHAALSVFLVLMALWSLNAVCFWCRYAWCLQYYWCYDLCVRAVCFWCIQSMDWILMLTGTAATSLQRQNRQPRLKTRRVLGHGRVRTSRQNQTWIASQDKLVDF